MQAAYIAGFCRNIYGLIDGVSQALYASFLLTFIVTFREREAMHILKIT